VIPLWVGPAVGVALAVVVTYLLFARPWLRKRRAPPAPVLDYPVEEPGPEGYNVSRRAMGLPSLTPLDHDIPPEHPLPWEPGFVPPPPPEEDP